MFLCDTSYYLNPSLQTPFACKDALFSELLYHAGRPCVAKMRPTRPPMVGAPFARLLANLVVMGTGVLGRAFLEAYKQALQSAFGPCPGCCCIAAERSADGAQTVARRARPPRRR